MTVREFKANTYAHKCGVVDAMVKRMIRNGVEAPTIRYPYQIAEEFKEWNNELFELLTGEVERRHKSSFMPLSKYWHQAAKTVVDKLGA